VSDGAAPQYPVARSLMRLVVFFLDRQKYGLELSAVERVVPMVAVSPLPAGPDAVVGAINLHGEIVPVFEVRRRLGLPHHDHGPGARLVIARSLDRTVALPVDDVGGVVDVPEDQLILPETVAVGTTYVSGIVALADGLLLIHDLDAFLSAEEHRQLRDALEGLV
jgi:purine-binding chemotaxis protein CheW